MTDLFLILFGLMFILGGVYFYLIKKTFNRLEECHPDKYDSLGRPSLISNNTPSNNIKFIKFIFKRDWKDLNDNKISSLGNKLIFLFVIYSSIFLALIIEIFSANAP
jgi:hypothetical protein